MTSEMHPVLPHHRLIAFGVARELLLAVRACHIRDAKLRDEASRSSEVRLPQYGRGRGEGHEGRQSEGLRHRAGRGGGGRGGRGDRPPLRRLRGGAGASGSAYCG